MSVIQYLSVQVLKIIYMFVIGNYSFHNYEMEVNDKFDNTHNKIII